MIVKKLLDMKNQFWAEMGKPRCLYLSKEDFDELVKYFSEAQSFPIPKEDQVSEVYFDGCKVILERNTRYAI